MQAIVQACRLERWDATVVGVISNVPDAQGLAFARTQGIATEVVDHHGFASRDEFDRALAKTIDKWAPDALAMAGFMRILGTDFVRRYAGRLLNIHPSLLPSFAGLNTHRRALQAGCKVTGATVHFVTPTLDHGPIVMQAAVHVMPGDTEASLSARVLAKEHIIYPQSLRWLLEGQLLIEGDHVKQMKGQAQWLL